MPPFRGGSRGSEAGHVCLWGWEGGLRSRPRASSGLRDLSGFHTPVLSFFLFLLSSKHFLPVLIIEDVLDRLVVALAAQGLGSMQALLEMTVDYCKTREQFGQPIGKFQALQHRMADMYLQCEALRSLLYDAAIAHQDRRDDRARTSSALKVKLGEAGQFVAQEAVQLHGGMGMTDELAVGHHLKSLLLLDTLFGDADYHLDRYLALSA